MSPSPLRASVGPMCGRYAFSADADTLVDEFGIDEVEADLPGPSWNIAPTDEVPVVLERHRQERDKQDRDIDEATVRRLRPLHWGLVPSWARDTGIGSRMINARVETVREKPAYRRAFGQRRCLLPADGFYEWYDTGERTSRGKPVKQPYFIRRTDTDVMAMAGLYEYWRDGSDGEWYLSCTVITTEAIDDVGRLHDRMPVVLGRELWDRWLDPARTDPDATWDLLQDGLPGAGTGEPWHAYPVSRDVGSVRNNGPHLIDPIEIGGN